MKKFLVTILLFWVEILLGIWTLFGSDIRWFLLYFFVVFLFFNHTRTDYLRKLVRYFQVHNEIKLLAIARKLKISDDELSIVMDGQKKNMGEKGWNDLEKEFEELKTCK